MKAEQLNSVLFCIFTLLMHGESGQTDEKRFPCSGLKSIKIQAFCDGVKDCPLGEDEIPAEQSEPTDEWQSCVNSGNAYNVSCSVRREFICKEDVICSNVNPCDLHCNNTHYRCQGSNKCVHRDTVCNNNPCDGCPGTTDWKNGIGFKCLRRGSECVLPQQLVLDDISDCDGEIDRCFGIVEGSSGNESVFLQDKCFRCLNDEIIIPKQHVCDGAIDCSDLSDECLCEGNKTEICDQVIKYDYPISVSNNFTMAEVVAEARINCEVGTVLCTNTNCIPRSSVCDGVKDCNNDEGSDFCKGTIPCGVATKPGELCRCQNSLYVCQTKYGKACDGINDCSDTASEDECSACFEQRSAVVTCPLADGISRPYRCQIVLSSDGNSTTPQDISNDRLCNGIPDCEFGDDEDNCPMRLKCDAVKLGYVSVGSEVICDGIEDCEGGEDEEEGRCAKTRFRCEVFDNQVSIDISLVCDGIINCNDGADELNCTVDGRFYCEGGKPLFVTKRQKFDGRGDCLDWSDECPIKNPVETDGFSSRYEMIGNPILRIIVWIMSLLSICGNSVVIFMVSKQLNALKRSSPVTVANKVLILNLAFSDILMGIYLAGLGIAGVTMHGRYCSSDLKWRSSSPCLGLGILAVLSSEASVMTMIMLTGCRLYAVFRPFKSSSNPRKRVLALMILLVWSAAVAMALIPLSRYLSVTFVTYVELKNNPFIRNVPTSLKETRRIFKELITYDLKANVTLPDEFSVDNLSFHDIEDWAMKLFVHDHFTIDRNFGYYSTNSVCLPKFFATKSDPAWRFSFFINLFNFLAFTLVASSYIAIYMHTQRKSEVRSSSMKSGARKQSSDLQAKILRLIITDFCCWIPICVMSFIKLGGIYLSNSAYVFAAIVLLPINSALNPILYSSVLDVLCKKVKRLSLTSYEETYSTSMGRSAGKTQGHTAHTSAV